MKDTQYRTIEFLRFLCAALVVLRHSAGAVALPSVGGGNSYKFIVALFTNGITEICVPTFFLISGFLFYSKLENWDWHVYKSKLKSRAKTLLLPYVSWNIIAFIALGLLLILRTKDMQPFGSLWNENGGMQLFWNCARKGAEAGSVNLVGYTMYTGFPLNGPLWFVRDLIILAISSPIYYYLVKKLGLGWLLITFIAYVTRVWIPYEGLGIVGIFYFSVGAYLRIKGKGLISTFYERRKLYYLSAFIMLVGVVICDLHFEEYHKYVSHLFTFLGSIACICVIASLYNHNRISDYKALSGASFMIFALHGVCLLSIVGSIFGMMPIQSNWWYVFSYFAMAGVTVTLCVFVDIILKRYAPFIYGILTGFRKKN